MRSSRKSAPSAARMAPGPARPLGAQDVGGTQHPQEMAFGEPRVEHGEARVGVAVRFPVLERPVRPDPADFPVPADDGPVRAHAEETGAQAAPDHLPDTLFQAGIVPVETARMGMDVHRGLLIEQIRVHAARLPINRP